jgi:hypothetical protein
MFFPALLAKFLSAGAVAQAASGAGICLVAFTGAGVVGVLPDPVQETFSSVVGTGTTTDDTTTDGTTTNGTTTEQTTVPAATTTIETPTTGVAENTETADPSDAAGFTLNPDESLGQQIHGQVDHGRIGTAKVSDLVHGRNAERKAGTTATPEAESGDDDSSSDQESGATESDETDSGSGGHGNSGRGHN